MDRLAGTVGQPLPELELRLLNAMARVPGAPRISELSGKIEADLQRIALREFKAKLGAGPVALEASIDDDPGPLRPGNRIPEIIGCRSMGDRIVPYNLGYRSSFEHLPSVRGIESHMRMDLSGN